MVLQATRLWVLVANQGQYLGASRQTGGEPFAYISHITEA
jgi:hypothetical protein